MIPVSALSESLQAKYYAKLKKGAGTAPELREEPASKPVKKVIKKRFEEYTAEQREEIAMWCGILRQWQELRENYRKKTDFDRDFCGMCRIEHNGIEISPDILYRKYAAFRINDYDSLIDKRGGWNRGTTSMNEDVWKMFTRIYLVKSQPTVSRCYRDIQEWTRINYPELYSSLPKERTFRRRIETIPECVLAFTRKGEKACFDKYLEYRHL